MNYFPHLRKCLVYKFWWKTVSTVAFKKLPCPWPPWKGTTMAWSRSPFKRDPTAARSIGNEFPAVAAAGFSLRPCSPGLLTAEAWPPAQVEFYSLALSTHWGMPQRRISPLRLFIGLVRINSELHCGQSSFHPILPSPTLLSLHRC